jgi:hypothetical protein
VHHLNKRLCLKKGKIFGTCFTKKGSKINKDLAKINNEG